MGLKNSRPLPLAHAELEMAPIFKRRFRTWHLDHVGLVVERYRALTMRHCIDAIQLSAILGIKEEPLVKEIMRLFMPKTPTRVHHMVDAMEIVIALVLVCQAPSMRHRFEVIFDVIDLNKLGVITPADLVVLFGAFGRTVMKLFEYQVEPEQRAAMTYVHTILQSNIAKGGVIEKSALCKLMLTDHYAVHYTKQCTGEAKPKLYILMEKDTEFLGAVEFQTQEQMKAATLRTIRDMASVQLHNLPNEFNFLCQGRKVKPVWEVDRKGWSIVPFAMRGSPGLRVQAIARNRHTECPRQSNTFEFRYMGNTIFRYKKKLHEINPVYRHRSFKIDSKNGGQTLATIVKWKVAENWSGEWLYDQARITGSSKTLIQKRLRDAPRATAERVAVKNHQGYLISPTIAEDDGLSSRPGTSDVPGTVTPLHAWYTPAKVLQKRLEAEVREKKVKLAARMIAMNALQLLDSDAHDAPELINDKENEPRHANRTKFPASSQSTTETQGTTVLIQVQEDRVRPSRLLQTSVINVKNTLTDNKDFNKSNPARLRVQVIPQRMELRTASTLSNGDICLGPFLTSSSIELKEDEVEVFPVLVIRPLCKTVEFPAIQIQEAIHRHEALPPGSASREHLRADSSYLSEYEFEVSPSESNFEHIYHHVHGETTDLITLNRRDVFGRSLLHDAAEFGHSKLIELLLKERVLRNIGDHRGDTPLHHAARRARIKEVSALLREGARPSQLNHEAKSPLFCALEAAAMQMRQSALAHKRPPARCNESMVMTRKDVQEKNFIATSERYSKMRQVIDLLWDRYPAAVLAQPDQYDRTSCLQLEQQVFGDLFQACRDGNLVRVQRLIDLEKRATAQYINEQLNVLGRTCLHEGAEQGHSAIVDILLKLGADGYICDQRQQLPLHVSAEKGFERIAKSLVSKFPGSVQAQDCVGKTPLHLAAERNHTSITLGFVAAIRDLPQSYEIVNSQDEHGYTALHYACSNANLIVCKALVDAGAKVNVSRYMVKVSSDRKHLIGVYWKHAHCKTRGKEGDGMHQFDIDSPSELLLRSCKQWDGGYQERLQIVKLLVSSAHFRSQGNTQFAKAPPPPLYHLAIEIASRNISLAIDMCKVLSELKYEVNLVHHQTYEPVILQECKRVCQQKIATEPGSASADCTELALLRILIQIGANVNLPNDRNGETPLACAAWFGHLPMLDLLLEAGAQCDTFPRNSFSPLHFAALGGHLACVKRLLGQQANVNIHALTSKQVEAPLFFAIRAKSETAVNLLLGQGADACALCSLQDGVTTSFGIKLVLEDAKRRHKKAVVRLPTFGPGRELIDHGAVRIASPLTFTLLVARSVRAYGSQTEAIGVSRGQKRHEWESLSRIAMMVATRAITTMTPSGSAGSSLITRNDVYLACSVGYWGLAKVLLTQQVVLPNAPTSSNMNALHLAAAAGQTAIATALVAAGMNVNCRVTDGGPSLIQQPTRSSQETIIVKHRGALYFALIHGHVETAAKLLVLGAKPLDTMPHTRIMLMWGYPRGDAWGVQDGSYYVRFAVHESMPKGVKDLFFADRQVLRSSESPSVDEYHHDRVAANFVSHLGISVNSGIPLHYYAAGMGYTSMVKLLIEAGMSVSVHHFHVNVHGRLGSRPEWYAETAIHVAILCGHLDVVQYFASLVQFNFPRYFSREEKKPRSLLIVACKAKRVDILRYLLSSGSPHEDGGGYNMLETPDDIAQATNCCASSHFVDGFLLLVSSKSRPDMKTLAMVIAGINWNDKKRMYVEQERPLGDLEVFPTLHHVPRATTRRDMRRNLVQTMVMLDAIAPFAKDPEAFFEVLSFDHVLAVMIICSQYEIWRVFQDIFLANEHYFLEPLNPWKPILVRAASCCMVMHRAAKANEVAVLSFFVRLGVLPELRLAELPQLARPVRFAATHGALQAFLFLALQSRDLGESLDIQRWGQPTIQYRTIACSTSVFSATSLCRWQNMSSMSCYNVPTHRSYANLVQKVIHLWVAEAKQPAGNSLLHVACEHGDPVLVQLLLDAGADVCAENALRATPLMAAAKRKDSFGAAIVRCILGAVEKRQETERSADPSRALIVCYMQAPPCNLKIAKLLLAGGADANFEDKVVAESPLRSALGCALRTAQFAATKLLLDNGAKLSLSLSEIFLSSFQVVADNMKTHWRQFSSYLKSQGMRLPEVESIMLLLLDKRYAPSCMNEDLLHEMLTVAAAIAATTAKQSGQEKPFWSVCTRIMGHHGGALSCRKTVWGKKSALHYAVQSLEVGLVQQLVEVCSFEVDAEDEQKQTPLHIVASNGDAAICHLLLCKLEDQSRVDCADSYGHTPLHVAAIRGHEAVVAQLLRAGASVQMRCHRGFNAHVYASMLNHVAILMALFDRDSSRSLLYAASGEFAMFLAARNAAFRVVRWYETVFESVEPQQGPTTTFYSITCIQYRRLVLHYAAMFGDIELVKQIVSSSCAKTRIDVVDSAGYTPLMYAFAFGKLAVVELLLQAGADPARSVDHSGEANTHPYACRFSIASLRQWFALPGWYSFVANHFPNREKRVLTRSFLTDEHYLLASGYHRRVLRAPVDARRYGRQLAPVIRNVVVRSTIRSWNFPKTSLFQFAIEVGDQNVIELLARLPLPVVTHQSSAYGVLRRAFLEAVQWNRIDIVKQLISLNAGPFVSGIGIDRDKTNSFQFSDFLESAVDRAVSRGLQEMAILLLSQWQGIKENGRTGADANAFAFQFAQAFQVACIRRLTAVVDYMITRGGEQIVSFHWNEGPALVYAFAFGHPDIARRLLEHGGHISTMDTYVAPSFKKWIEYGCPKEVQVQWYELSAARASSKDNSVSAAPFVGPLEEYEPRCERLDAETMAELFLPAAADGVDEVGTAATTAATLGDTQVAVQ